jgi:hypothetical protein
MMCGPDHIGDNLGFLPKKLYSSNSTSWLIAKECGLACLSKLIFVSLVANGNPKRQIQ